MSVDYDLVIIGYTPEGVYAALNAVSFQKRVALVSQNCSGSCHPFYSYALQDLGQRFYRENNPEQFELIKSVNEIDLTSEISRIEKAITTISDHNSPANLSAAGVDFIEGVGEFCRRPHLAFLVGERKLRSRSYLLTTGTKFITPQIKSLQDVGYLTPDLLWKSDNLQKLPQTLAILGGTALALELAQSLTRLGKTVTLILEGQLLPSEEPEATRLIQAKLEAEGIAIFTHSPVTQVKTIAQKKWLQVGNNAIEVDEIIWSVGYEPNLDSLNLEGLGIDPQNPQVNSHQQTQHPQIYLCSGIEDAFELSHLSRYQVDIALHHALLLGKKKRDRVSIPRIIFTYPNLARVGLTEWEAQQKYGDDFKVYHHHLKQISRAILEEKMTGFLKIILNQNGKILGATLVGEEAGELINLISLAIQNNIKIDRLAQLYCPSPSFSEIIAQIAVNWQRDRFQKNTLRNKIYRFWLRLHRRN